MRAQMLFQPADIKSNPLQLRELDIPKPAPSQVLIKNRVCGICRTDLHVVEGDLELKKLPIIPGHQVVGEIIECGAGVTDFKLGDRVGVAWLHATCGKCRFCLSYRENLCESALFTGWTAQGGFADAMVAPAQFVYRIPDTYPDIQAAPLLCAGIIGYRALRLMNIADWSGRRIGIYGFGAAGHIAIQLLKAWGADVYVCTRETAHQKLAQELGAVWTGGTIDQPPVPLDGAVVFAPAGEIIPPALKALDRDGRLILAGIHMSPIPSFSYDILYGERMVKSVTNNTRQDGIEFLEQAAKIGIKTHVQTFPLEEANKSLRALKYDHIQGAGVLLM
ncbi:MAG TPA: zinc-dependent alcohol dehydrogenase family protein [Alphaproteobacteria bacterium]|nr:zinc-dependent alcohol dehydrogenase family protein [Alphaproteobacteria bacterium]